MILLALVYSMSMTWFPGFDDRDGRARADDINENTQTNHKDLPIYAILACQCYKCKCVFVYISINLPILLANRDPWEQITIFFYICVESHSFPHYYFFVFLLQCKCNATCTQEVLNQSFSVLFLLTTYLSIWDIIT